MVGTNDILNCLELFFNGSTPSAICTFIKTNNIDYIRNIYKLYPSERKLEFTKEQLLNRQLSIEYTNIQRLTIIIKKIAKIFGAKKFYNLNNQKSKLEYENSITTIKSKGR